MVLTPTPPAIVAVRNSIASRPAMAVSAAKRDNERPFTELSAKPLNDVNRDAFLALIEDDSQPNAALSAAAARFKSLGL